jgi:NADH:ubiquinone oxidoreductase subunit K
VVAVAVVEITVVVAVVVAYYLELLQQHQEYYSLQQLAQVGHQVALETEYWQQQEVLLLLSHLTYLYHVQAVVLQDNLITALVKAELLVAAELHLVQAAAVEQLQHVL